jgi:hypothetical protein
MVITPWAPVTMLVLPENWAVRAPSLFFIASR